MEDFDSTQLKTWREKLDLSQKRLAELANISLTTLRQLEFGTHRPQGRTLKKILEVMHGVESGSLTHEAIHPPRHRRQKTAAPEPEPVVPAPVAPAPVVAEAPAVAPVVPKRRGRPPKAAAPIAPVPAPAKPAPARVAAKPAPPPAPVEAAPAPVPALVMPVAAPAPAPKPVSPGPAGIQLSNLDLELINRVLNMTGREKLALLEKLM